MSEHVWRLYAVVALSAWFQPEAGHAQSHHHHAAPADSTAHVRSKTLPQSQEANGHERSHGGMDMAGMDMGDMPMSRMYRSYAMSREASGTAWQPEAAR